MTGGEGLKRRGRDIIKKRFIPVNIRPNKKESP